MDVKAFPYSIADTLNQAAGATKKAALTNVKKKLRTRTPYTLRSIKQDRKAFGTNINKMYARVGSNSSYLWKHDEGYVQKANRRKIPLPFVNSTRGGDINRIIVSRYRMNKLGEIKGNKRFFKGVPKGRVGLKSYGIWERVNRNKSIRRVRALTHSQVKIKPVRWFSGAVDRFGTPQYMSAAFNRIAEARIDKLTRRG